MSLCMQYVCIVIVCVFACNSTCALCILKTCFIDELHIDTVTVLTCNVHNSAIEYNIFKCYTYAVYNLLL